MSAVRAVEPPNQARPGMLAGHMTFRCVTTVPNSLLKVSVDIISGTGHTVQRRERESKRECQRKRERERVQKSRKGGGREIDGKKVIKEEARKDK